MGEFRANDVASIERPEPGSATPATVKGAGISRGLDGGLCGEIARKHAPAFGVSEAGRSLAFGSVSAYE